MKIPVVTNPLQSQAPSKAEDEALDRFLEDDRVWVDFRDPVKGKVRSQGELSTAQRLRSEFISLAERSMATIAGGDDSEVVPVFELAAIPSSAKTNEEAATDALKMVRLALYTREYGSFKSDNKTTAFDLLAGYGVASDGTFAEMQNFGNITDYRHISALRSRNIWSSTKINCHGLAVAAMDYVKSRYPNMQVALLGFATDHAVAVLGTLEAELKAAPLNKWPKHLFICDPWANIVCSAPEYRDKFFAKMEKWKSVDKLILNSSNEWVCPINSKWLACVDAVPQIFPLRSYSDGQFNDLLPFRLPTQNELCTGATAPDGGLQKPVSECRDHHGFDVVKSIERATTALSLARPDTSAKQPR